MKLNILNLAKIKNSEIEIKPLTIFVGKNGTNKSYMAHLIYELYKEISILGENKSSLGKLIKDFIILHKSALDSLESLITNEKEYLEHYQVDQDEYETDVGIEFTFSQDKIKTFEINLYDEIYSYIMAYLIEKIEKSYNSSIKTIEKVDLTFDVQSIFSENDIIIRAETKEQAYYLFIRMLFNKIFEVISSNIKSKESFYFPSSRTGFVLAFDEIVSGVFRDRFGGQPTATKLTQPTIDFLSNFAEIKTGKFRDDNTDDFFMNPFKKKSVDESSIINELITYLQQEILQGEILENTNSEKYTQYLLKTSNNVNLDLHVSSSATIELLPLIVFLKHFTKIKNRFLVIEEPEAHLHPNAQIAMARFIVMLVNNGAQVLITTHSDYMIEELNNCIQLKNTKQTIIEKYNLDNGLGEKIHLDENNINVYLFKDNMNDVEVTQLEINEDGIPYDNFDAVRAELEKRQSIYNSLKV